MEEKILELLEKIDKRLTAVEEKLSASKEKSFGGIEVYIDYREEKDSTNQEKWWEWTSEIKIPGKPLIKSVGYTMSDWYQKSLLKAIYSSLSQCWIHSEREKGLRIFLKDDQLVYLFNRENSNIPAYEDKDLDEMFNEIKRIIVAFPNTEIRKI